MALEKICGFDKLTFMKADQNVECARREFQRAQYLYQDPYLLRAPPFPNPEENLNKILARSNLKMNMTHGTTTLGFKYQGGIVLCADSRGSNKSYVTTQKARKIIELDEGLLGTVAGGASDCTYWDRVIARECHLHSIRYGKSMPVTSASRIMCNIAHSYKGMGLVMGMIFAGYDPEGPKLLYVDSEGQRTEGNSFAVGSGSSHALCIIDTSYKFDMTDEEAYAVARRAIYHATYLDPYSGGLIRLYHITRSGWKMISAGDCLAAHNWHISVENIKYFKNAEERDAKKEKSTPMCIEEQNIERRNSEDFDPSLGKQQKK